MRITRIGVAATIVLVSCGGGDEAPVEPASPTTSVVADEGLDDLFQEVETEDQVSETFDGAGVEPPARNPPSTDPPATDPPTTDTAATDTAATDTVATDPAVTDPPAAAAVVTDPPVTAPPTTDPPGPAPATRGPSSGSGTVIAPPESGTVGSSAVFPGNSGLRMASEGIDRQMAVELG